MRVNNPFIISNEYIAEEYFCDRKFETKVLVDNILNGRNTVLISIRRMGKSGLISHCFNDKTISKSYATFFIDLYSTSSLAEMVSLMGKEILDSLKGKGEKIIDRFVESYRNGLTPNPCIDCNRYMKFDKLLYRAQELECDLVVTGHYARVEEENGRFLLKKAADEKKDQSYVLYSLTQAQLSHIRFPLGGLTKDEVRVIAEENGFVNAKKKDSQDICFVPDGDYAAFIERYAGAAKKGDFLLSTGEKVGEHKGIVHYTLGQRKHLGIALGKPVFVTKIDPVHNTVTLGDEEELLKREALVKEFNWILGEAPDHPVRCMAKTRYRQKEVGALAYPLSDGGVRIVFDTPVRAVTPGQAAVLYDGDIVLGGGVIVQ